MEKKIYITKEEQEKCRKVADAFTELYEIENILVMDAGRFGYVKLQYYRQPYGFDDVITFTDSKKLSRLRKEREKSTPLQIGVSDTGGHLSSRV